MANNLGPPSTNASDQRPHQKGRLKGTKHGLSTQAAKEWLIDTGATVSVITRSNANLFDLTTVAGSAKTTTGGAGILMKKGASMEFEIEDKGGWAKTVTCSLPIGVKRNNAGSEILGMDQVAQVGAAVDWDPKNQTGRLYEV